MKVAQLLGLRGPWRRQVCGDADRLHRSGMSLSGSFFRPLVAGDQTASLASVSLQLRPHRHLEGSLAGGLLGRSVDHLLKEAPWLGSYSVVQTKHLKGQPLYCSAFNAGCGEREAMVMLHPLHVTPQYRLASMAARLSSTGISHHSLLPHIPSVSPQSIAAFSLGLLHNP